MNDRRRPIDEALWYWRLLHNLSRARHLACGGRNFPEEFLRNTESPSREVCDTVVEPVSLAKSIPLSGNASPAEPAKPATQKWGRWGDRLAAMIAEQKAISAARKTGKDQTIPVRQPDATE
jgi:hypothetical protein